jgi:hypothetical protein
VFRKLYVGRRPTLNKLTSTIDADDATLQLTYSATGIAAGARIAIGLEDMHVWEVDGTTLTVERALGGSTAAAHTADDVVYVNPMFTSFEVLTAVNEVLDALPGLGVVQFKTVDLTSDPTVVGYDLTSVGDLLRVHRVSFRALGSELRWPVLPRAYWSVQQKSSTSDFASAESLFLHVDIDPGVTLRVMYQAPFVNLSTLADNVATVAGMPVEQHHLLAVGAAYRMLLGRPVARSSMDGQGDTRRPGEVSTSDTRAGALPITQEWLTAIQSAKRDQTRKYGL